MVFEDVGKVDILQLIDYGFFCQAPPKSERSQITPDTIGDACLYLFNSIASFLLPLPLEKAAGAALLASLA